MISLHLKVTNCEKQKKKKLFLSDELNLLLVALQYCVLHLQKQIIKGQVHIKSQDKII